MMFSASPIRYQPPDVPTLRGVFFLILHDLQTGKEKHLTIGNLEQIALILQHQLYSRLAHPGQPAIPIKEMPVARPHAGHPGVRALQRLLQQIRVAELVPEHRLDDQAPRSVVAVRGARHDAPLDLGLGALPAHAWDVLAQMRSAGHL